MTLKLRPIPPDGDAVGLAGELAAGFGEDEAAALDILEQTIRHLKKVPRPDPWGSYLAYADETAVGTCAFKGAPDSVGLVEIAYMTFPAFERRGHAGAMTAALVAIAATGGASTAIAHTLPQENASNRALRRNGFVFAGQVDDPEDGPVWRWEKPLGRLA